MSDSTHVPPAWRKLWQILTPAQRRTAIALLGFMLIGMVLETFGISLVIPALALLTQDDFGVRYPILAPLLDRVGNPGREQLVLAGMLFLVGVFAIKALFLAFLSWRQMCFVFGFQADLSRRLFLGYVQQPYNFHLQRNSAELIRNVIGEVSALTNVTQPGLTVITEVLVLLGISVLLLAVQPFGAVLVVSILGLVGWAFHRVTRGRILRWGEARQLHEGLRIQHLQQALGGAKEVKLLGREAGFLAQYQVHNAGAARVMKNQYTLQSLPRLGLELMAIIGLAALVLVLMWQGRPLDNLIPTVGLFAVAAFRVLPSLNRVISSVQAIRFALPVIDTLYDEIRMVERPQTTQHGEPFVLSRTLTLDGVSFCYANTETSAVRDVSLTIHRGTSVGFIGTSGAGKSTLVDIVLGLLGPETGTVQVDGVDIQSNLRAWQDQIGYVPQEIFLIDDTLRRNIAFGLPDEEIDNADVWRTIRATQLESFVEGLPLGLETIVGERGIRLSGGQRQRIGIARALYHDPQVLVLDEATSSLDTATERDVMDAVRALHGEKTLLIVSHRLSTVEHCDRLFHLENGAVVEDGKAAIVLGKIGRPAS